MNILIVIGIICIAIAIAISIDISSYNKGWDDCFDTIMNGMHKVDAVPVVRCGKCIHSRLDEDDGLICQMHYLPTAEENFCSYGETWEEPEINPCRGCKDYDWNGGCKSNGGCGMDLNDTDINVRSKTDEVTE